MGFFQIKIKMDKQKQLLQKVSEAITEKPVTLDIEVKPKNRIHAWLLKRKLAPLTRHYEIKPQRVVNVYRIAGRAVLLDVAGIIGKEDNIGLLMQLMAKHGEDLFYIVAAAIQNNHKEPSEKLIRIVKNEFEMKDLFTVLSITVSNYNISAFLNSIALIVGVDALKIKSEQASPQVKGS